MAEWYSNINGRNYGPIEKEVLMQWIHEGRVGREDYIWSEGMADWAKAGTIFSQEFNTITPGLAGHYRYVRPHRGGTILALGIIGLVVCWILGIFAWTMGNKDLRRMRLGKMDPSGKGMTQAGKICGMVSVIIAITSIGVMIFFIVLDEIINV